MANATSQPANADVAAQTKYVSGHFGYSAINPQSGNLGASGYTEAVIVVDVSGSTRGFQEPMEKALKAAVTALQKDNNADSIMVRVVTFSDGLEELHGFLPVSEIDPTRYDGKLAPKGMTAGYDACIAGAESIMHYAGELRAARYFPNNGILIVITDGLNNAGKFYQLVKDVQFVAEKFKAAAALECLDSFMALLIAVNTSYSDRDTMDFVRREGVPGTINCLGDVLRWFNGAAGFSQHMIDLNDASEATIAKVTGIVRDSVSSTSSARGTGAPSQSVF